MDNRLELVKRYPRIVTALLAEAQEVEVIWAAKVLEEIKQNRSPLARSLVREAVQKRHRNKSTEASKAVREVSDSGRRAA